MKYADFQMLMSKVVKSTHKMHIFLNLIFKKGHTIKMGAISYEILCLLKVKLPLQNDQRWLLLLSWISKLSRGGPSPPPPPPPPSRQENVTFIFQSNTSQNKPSVKSEVFSSGFKQQEDFLYLFVIRWLYICWLRIFCNPTIPSSIIAGI